MTVIFAEMQSGIKPTNGANEYGTGTLSLPELIEIAIYTVQKINNYPKRLGKTVEDYFHLLYPDEIKAHLMRQAINSDIDQGEKLRTMPRAKLIKNIRTLCQLPFGQQSAVICLILDKADELAVYSSAKDAYEVETYGE
jgi:hypothetical protein